MRIPFSHLQYWEVFRILPGTSLYSLIPFRKENKFAPCQVQYTGNRYVLVREAGTHRLIFSLFWDLPEEAIVEVVGTVRGTKFRTQEEYEDSVNASWLI